MDSRKKISVLGSTGSIGTQTLEVMEALGYEPAVLSANRNTALLEAQVRKYRPPYAAVFDRDAARDLKIRLRDTATKLLEGEEGIIYAAGVPCDAVVTAVVGMIGLKPTMTAIENCPRVAIANKETLVCAGFVTEHARKHGTELIPVDSEHSAIFQCLEGARDKREIKRLILTASGGPFYGRKAGELDGITPEMAVRHPKWNMGAKISVDSATLMNKGLELIEAMRLYGLPADKISIVVHRESIIHSMIEYIDNSVIAQLAVPDMRLPIQYALTWPRRMPGLTKALDFTECGPLTFGKPDMEAFACLRLAIEAAGAGGNRPVVLNAANEEAVALFLSGRIKFTDISEVIRRALDKISVSGADSLEDVIKTDAETRRFVKEAFAEGI